MPASNRISAAATVGALSVIALACQATDPHPTDLAPSGALTSAVDAPGPPPGLITIALGGAPRTLWPYVGSDFTGTPQDPVNLLMLGENDPRRIRAALLRLDGDRGALGFPPVFPFNCTWSDAIGDIETGYAEPAGWTGSAVQLQCGEYQPIRFHLRLLAAGAVTIANAHFEALIPGTADHQVLSWELAEQLVKGDLIRSGILDPATPWTETDLINAAPFRTIPAVIFNGLPPDLRVLVTGSPAPAATDVPIPSDGHATVFNVAQRVPIVPGTANQDFVLQYGQVVPKPFCASGPLDFLLIEGPVHLIQQSSIGADGTYRTDFRASGKLSLTPVNPATSPPTATGESYFAEVGELHKSSLWNSGSEASSLKRQMELPRNVPGRGRLLVQLRVGTNGTNQYRREEDCD